MDNLKNKENIDELETKMYRSCLKQLVNYLNSKLPKLEESSFESVVELEEKPKRVKKLPKEIIKEEFNDSYKLKDVTPTRKFKKVEEIKKEKKKRFNKYSERKYNDIKALRSFKKHKK